MQFVKTMLSLFLFFSFVGNSFAQYAEGVIFLDSSWEEVIELAQKEDKLIFLDAYTDWCQPCKAMDRDVFPKKEIGDLINDSFVSVKINMEKGEGLALREKYNIKAYPTLLFVDANEKQVHRIAGYQNVEQLLSVAKIALDPTKRLHSMKEKFDSGNRDEAFLKKYAKASLKALDGSHIKIAEAYLETQEKWSSTKNMDFIYTFLTDTDTKMFDYLIENKARFSEMYGTRKITQKIQGLIYNEIEDAKDESSINQIDKLYAKVYPQQAKELSANFRMSFYRNAGDYEKYTKAVVDYMDQFDVQGERLNDIAWTFYEKVDDKSLLKKATKWVKKSIKINSNYYNNDTLAALYYKLGKKKKAIKTAKKAISLAKENKQNHDGSDELLRLIEEGK